LYIDDFIDGLLMVFEKATDSRAVNIASGKPVNIRETLSLILNEVKYSEAKVKFDPTKPSMLPIRMIDISRARSEFGWYPKVSLAEGIKRTVEWYSEYYENISPEDRT
jgi:GDP-L-fucose synthase